MNDPSIRRALDAYRVPEAPTDLADRVLEGVRRPARVPGRSFRRGTAWAMAAAAAVAVLLLLAPPPTETSTGSYRAPRRGSIRIGGRGTAVAEAGADLDWTVSPVGAARVEQRRGDVFYRVERGGPFVVETSAGAVEVTGTCFRVEVEPMKLSRQHIVAAGVGAALSAAVIVTVYEGRVLLASPRGSVAVGPGERARAEAGSAPAVLPGRAAAPVAVAEPPAGDPTREQLAAQNATARRELAAAQTRIAVLEAQLERARQGSGGYESRVDPTPETLRAWAERCEIHLAAPSVFGASPSRPTARELAAWGVTEAEQPEIERTLAALHESTREEMRAIYVDATGDSHGADELSAATMFGEIFSKSLPADVVRARQRMARERAGLQPPPANLSALPPVERALRLVYRVGDDFERALAEAITPERAHALRTFYGGWPGLHYGDSGCEGQ